MELFVKILMDNGSVLHLIMILLWNAIKERTLDPRFSYIFWGSEQKGNKIGSLLWVLALCVEVRVLLLQN